MPANLYTLFRNNEHSEIFEVLLDAPWPLVLEWEFVGGDKVHILDGPSYSQSVEGAYVIVDLDGDEAIIRIVPHLLHKKFSIDDFVKVLQGESKDWMGWIQGIDDNHIDIIEKEGNDASIKVSEQLIRQFSMLWPCSLSQFIKQQYGRVLYNLWQKTLMLTYLSLMTISQARSYQ